MSGADRVGLAFGDLVGAKVSRSGLLIATGDLVPAAARTHGQRGMPLDYHNNDRLAKEQLAIGSNSMAETSTQRACGL